jgi:hypothetical protein
MSDVAVVAVTIPHVGPGLCHSARRPPEMARNSEPGMNAAAFLGGELKRARAAAGRSHEHVARV